MSETKLHARAWLSGSGRFLLGFAVLTGLLYIGNGIVRWLGVPIPPAIMSMMLLLLLLIGSHQLVPVVEAASMPLLRHMMLFFIPAVSGVMDQFQALKSGWLPFVVASIAGAVLTLTVTVLTFRKLLQIREARS